MKASKGPGTPARKKAQVTPEERRRAAKVTRQLSRVLRLLNSASERELR